MISGARDKKSVTDVNDDVELRRESIETRSDYFKRRGRIPEEVIDGEKLWESS